MTRLYSQARTAMLLAALLLPGAGMAEAFAVQVAPGVHVHAGKHHDLQHEHRADIANVGFVVGEQCIAVIDTGGSVEIGKRLLAAVRAVSALPVCYVINTHVHFDHLLGNAAFTDTEARFVGHAGLARAVHNSLEFFQERFATELGTAELPAPDMVVARGDELRLDLGNRELLLKAWPPAHTDHDLTVLDVQTATLWTGDLLFRERLPIFEASLRGWLSIMEQLGLSDAQRIVPGHGSVTEQAFTAAAADQLRYLSLLLEGTRAQISAGAFLEEVAAQVGQSERGRWELFDEIHPTNVNRAFRELEWE